MTDDELQELIVYANEYEKELDERIKEITQKGGS